jgi:SSS family solute:Na+ symporter
VFFVVVAGMVLISKLAEQRGHKESKGLEIDSALFRVSPGFAAGAAVIGVILVSVYALWW